MAQDIWYLEDEKEVTRRSKPPPPIVHLPSTPAETPEQRDDRIRTQKLYDEHRRTRETKFEQYQEQFAKDYAKAIAVHYSFLSPTIQMDINRAIEELDPPTTDIAIHYKLVVSHTATKWGPNSVKDSQEAKGKLDLLRIDERGADVYLAAVFSIIDLLTKTPIRDAANNPIMEPVPPRPHLPRPLTSASPHDHLAYIAADEADQLLWEATHPANKIKNHRPTDEHIKNVVILALAASSFTHYSTLAHQYQQVDHATRTWADLRTDLQSRIQNTAKGTSRDPSSLPRKPRTDRAEWNTLTRVPLPTLENRYARHDQDDHRLRANYDAMHRHDHRTRHDRRPSPGAPLDVRSASPGTAALTPLNKFPCANCYADHKTVDCDSLTCGQCEGTFPTAEKRKAHYQTYHRNEQTTKRARFNTQRPSTPPTTPFLSRSARSTEDNYASSYDSGYDSTASGPGRPPSSRGNSDVDEQADRMIDRVYDQRLATFTNTLTDLEPDPTDIRTITTHTPNRTFADRLRQEIQYLHSPLNSNTAATDAELPDLIPDSDDEPPPFLRRARYLPDTLHSTVLNR